MNIKKVAFIAWPFVRTAGVAYVSGLVVFLLCGTFITSFDKMYVHSLSSVFLNGISIGFVSVGLLFHLWMCYVRRHEYALIILPGKKWKVIEGPRISPYPVISCLSKIVSLKGGTVYSCEFERERHDVWRVEYILPSSISFILPANQAHRLMSKVYADFERNVELYSCPFTYTDMKGIIDDHIIQYLRDHFETKTDMATELIGQELSFSHVSFLVGSNGVSPVVLDGDGAAKDGVVKVMIQSIGIVPKK